MPWPDAVEPVRMQRVAVVAPRATLRDVLVLVAGAGCVEVDAVVPAGERELGEAGRRLQRLAAADPPGPVLARQQPDLDVLEGSGRADLLAGEAELETRAADALVRGDVAALAGWAPAAAVPQLAELLAPVGGAVVPLSRPRGTDPPTMLRPTGRLHRTFAPLVDTYATVPYADVDPTVLAGLAYVVMFGMMFADAGHGALLVVAGLLLRAGRPARLRRFRGSWLFVTAAGLCSMVFGVLFGEFFGPTGVVPVLWLEPLEEPVTLLLAALGVGAVLLAAAYAVGAVNRWREGGWRLTLVAPSGLAGSALFLGLGLLVLGFGAGWGWVVALGALVATGGLTLAFIGLLAAAGGGAAGVAQASVEIFDAVLRVGTNLVSFARLAAFGLTHAALGLLVWRGATALWEAGGPAVLGAVAVFLVGTAVAFTLEAVIAGVQALRLEYYELFSRVFATEGRPFRPWQVPTAVTAATGSPAPSVLESAP
jgi:V/A-type H+/Na+-transporting ATPase subunit I